MTRRRSTNPLAQLSRHELTVCRQRAERELNQACRDGDRAAEAQAQLWIDGLWGEIRRRDLAGLAKMNKPPAPIETDEPTAVEIAMQKAGIQ